MGHLSVKLKHFQAYQFQWKKDNCMINFLTEVSEAYKCLILLIQN